jgi:predicted chitinase
VVEFRNKFLQEDLRPSWELLADQEKLELDQKNRWRAVLEFVLFAVNNASNSNDLNKKINGNGNGVFNAKKKIRRLGWGEAS